MSTSITADVARHLNQRGPALDLTPYCGVVPGHDEVTYGWNTRHDRDKLLRSVRFDLPARMTRVSPAALDGFTPLIRSKDGD